MDNILRYIDDKKFTSWVLHPNAETDAYWEKYISMYPDQLDVINMAKSIVLAIQTKQSYLSKEEKYLLLDDFKNRVNELKKQRGVKMYWMPLVKIAAVLLLICTLVSVLHHFNSIWQSNNSQSAFTEIVVKSTPSGKKSLVTLPDGTTVKLNSESQLEYSNDFSSVRKVKLVGEAFFEVVSDATRPFVVESSDIGVKVLGTSFNVQAFSFTEQIKIALVEGKVEVLQKAGVGYRPIEYLQPNEMLVYNLNNKHVGISTFDHKLVLGWKDGELNFKNMDFLEVIDLLERWYGVEIEVRTNKPMKSEYHGSYKNEPLITVLEGLAFVDDFKFELNGNEVIIK